MTDLRLLRAFLEVSRSGTMADAALALRCTGPAVSQQMSRLEAEFGVPLLVRNNHGVTLTEAGEVLAHRSAQLLGASVNLRSAVQDAANFGRIRLRLNSFSSASVYLLPAAIIQFRLEFPDAELSIHDSYADRDPFDYLKSGDVDLLVVHEYDHVPLEPPEGVVLHALGRDRMDVVLSKTHPLARKRSLRLTDLAEQDWVLFPKDNIATVSIVNAAGEVGFVPKSAFEGAHYTVVNALVGAGVGVSLLPRMVTRNLRESPCVTRPLIGSSLGRNVSVAVRDGGNSRAIEAMRLAIAKQFRNAIHGPA